MQRLQSMEVARHRGLAAPTERSEPFHEKLCKAIYLGLNTNGEDAKPVDEIVKGGIERVVVLVAITSVCAAWVSLAGRRSGLGSGLSE